jgi:hypothetical protein
VRVGAACCPAALRLPAAAWGRGSRPEDPETCRMLKFYPADRHPGIAVIDHLEPG